MWQILFPSPSSYSQACFQNSGVFLPACTALSSWSACRRVLAEVTDGLLTARSSGALPRLRLAFLGRVAFLCPPCLLNWASLSPSFLPRYLACFKHWHFSQAESQAEFTLPPLPRPCCASWTSWRMRMCRPEWPAAWLWAASR